MCFGENPSDGEDSDIVHAQISTRWRFGNIAESESEMVLYSRIRRGKRATPTNMKEQSCSYDRGPVMTIKSTSPPFEFCRF